MRQIKFRAWHSALGEYIKGNEWHLYGPSIIRGEINQDVCVVEQFTGLHDSNGVEVYEGDIVSDHVGIGSVVYSESNAGFRLSYGDGRAKWFYDYNLRGERESIAVIGNIHENPELLESQE